MKVLVIGANGYIGNVVAQQFALEGWNVVGSTRSQDALDRLQRQGITPHLGSLEQPESLLPAILESDAVIYSAYGYTDPEGAKQEIQTGKSHISFLLQSLFGSNKIFVLTSGTGVYSDTKDTVFTESMPFPSTDSPTTIARRNLEKEVQDAEKHGVHSIVLRPPIVYGQGGSFLVPRTLLEHARSSGESVYIEGTENNKWSTVHVNDLADLYVLAVKKAPAGSLFNAGSESGITTGEIAASVSRAANLGGITKSISLEESRKLFGTWGDFWSISNQCSGDKARAELDWKPHQLSILDDIERGSYAAETAANPH